MVGAGQLIRLLFGLDYNYAVICVGLLMIVYVTFGGMVATTWVQIIKACLLLGGGTAMLLPAPDHTGLEPVSILISAQTSVFGACRLSLGCASIRLCTPPAEPSPVSARSVSLSHVKLQVVSGG